MQTETGLVCGVDEAGRGPLAGAVYAAAVILDPRHPIAGLRDSKMLSERNRDRLAAELPEAGGLPDLSMGMSGDFTEAILEGATLVRIGSALFEGVV